MPTDLGRQFPPVIVKQPPHMAPEDTRIYKRWALTGLKNALRQFFDVGLGRVEVPPTVKDPALIKDWIRVNQKRADAVIEYDDHVKIVELRHEVTPNAIGRILTYRELWKDDPVIKKPLRLLIVSNRHDKDVERLCIQLGIMYEWV